MRNVLDVKAICFLWVMGMCLRLGVVGYHSTSADMVHRSFEKWVFGPWTSKLWKGEEKRITSVHNSKCVETITIRNISMVNAMKRLWFSAVIASGTEANPTFLQCCETLKQNRILKDIV